MATCVDGLIRDHAELRGARSEYGNAIPVWDDGFGPLWVYRDEMGIVGIVRAQTWHDALDCAYDELLKPIADDEIPEAYGFDSQAALDAAVALARDGRCEYPDLDEGYSYQSNSTGNGIVAPSYNEALDELTPALLARLGIVLDIVRDEDEDES